jgi:FAD/FMN-containing dehydrogenase
MDNIQATFSSFLGTDEIIEPSSPNYYKETQVWSAHKNLHPKLVVRPKSIASLSKILRTINETDIEFTVRGGGCGSTSTRGVLISMSTFDSFEFNQEDETVTIGAGQLWRDVDRKVEQLAPGYSGK